MDANELLEHELQAALEGLDPAAAPLVAALIGHGCIALPEASLGPMLDLLGTVADQAVESRLREEVDTACVAMVAFWLESQASHSGAPVADPGGLPILRALGYEHAARAATVFALVVASAVCEHARMTSGTDDFVTLH